MYAIIATTVLLVLIFGISLLVAGRNPSSDAERSTSWIRHPPDGGAGL